MERSLQVRKSIMYNNMHNNQASFSSQLSGLFKLPVLHLHFCLPGSATLSIALCCFNPASNPSLLSNIFVQTCEGK